MATNSSNWIFDIQQKIYSRLSAVCTAELGTKYSGLNVTMDSHIPETPAFPNVYLHFLPAAEVGKDLDSQYVNAIYLTAEIEITVTDAQGMVVANEVSSVVLDCMKDMRFTATMPEFRDTDSEYRTVSRYARTIGDNETIYTV